MTPLLMFGATFVSLLAGYPVALTLAGVALLFAFAGMATGAFNPNDLGFLPSRLFGTMTNQTMLAVPVYLLYELGIFMSRLVGRKAAEPSEEPAVK